MNGKDADPDYTDYIMSKEFGLDWRKYEGTRMTKFIHIKKCEIERDKRDNDKATNKSGAGGEKQFRPRV